MKVYGQISRVPRLRALLVLGLIVRVPMSGCGFLLTLHIVQQLGLGYAEAGVAAALYTLFTALSAPWRGRVLDKAGLRRTLLPTLLVLPPVWAVAPFVGYWPLLVLASIGGLLFPPVNSITRRGLVENSPEHLRRSVLALDSVIVEIAFMIGPALAIIMATSWRTDWTLLIFQQLTVLATVVLFIVNPPMQKMSAAELSGPKPRWVSAAAIGILIMALAITLMLGSAELAIVAAFRAMDAAGGIGFAITAWSLGSLLGGLVYGAAHKAIHPGWLLLALALTALPCMWATNPWLLAALLCLNGVCCAPSIAATIDYLSRLVPSARMGEVMGWHGSMITAGLALSAPTIGAVIDHYGWRGGFLGSALVGVVMLVLALAIGYRRTPAPSVQ